jgi:hypothetical protein
MSDPFETPTVRLPRMTVRRMMLAVAVMALLLAVCVSLRRSLDPTPEEWALDQAAHYERSIEVWRRRAATAPSALVPGFLRMAEEAPLRAARYRALARRYAEEGADWDEATWHGPYTCRLAPGRPAIVRWAVTADSGTGGPRVSIATETPCVVVRDRANDDDDGECFREIEVRVLEGPHEGLTIFVEREYLRCK